MERKVISDNNFKIKKVGSNVFVEGWANKYVSDRGKDIINTEAWELDNYKKVPMILFNHDKDKPIGKAVDIRATDGGLWVKAKLSSSKDPEISRIRDLVEEGILNAFSVGFDAKDEAKNADGINEIKNAELYEISIVTLPMNQDSIFSLSAKSLAAMSRKDAAITVLRAKGADLAADCYEKLASLEKEQRDGIVKAIAERADIDMDKLADILAGNVTEVADGTITALKEVLALDQKCNEEMKSMGKPEVGIMALLIQADSAEEAANKAKEAGYASDGVQETDEGFLIAQSADGEFVEGQTSKLNIAEGIVAVVGVKKPAAEEEQSEGEEETEEEEEKTISDDENKEDDTTEKSLKDVAPATGPISTANDGTPDMSENPYIAQAKQTNVLLAVLIQEFRALSAKLDKVVEVESPEEVSEDAPTQEVTEESKCGDDEVMKNLKGYLKDIETKLALLGA